MEIPKALSLPLDLGMYTLRIGFGFRLTSIWDRSDRRIRCALDLSLGVFTPSIPAVCLPLLRRVTLFIATILTARDRFDNR